MKNLLALLILCFVALPASAQLVQSSVIPASVLITPGTGFQFAAFSNPALIEYQVDSTGAFVKATFNQSFTADAIVFVAAFKQKAGCRV